MDDILCCTVKYLYIYIIYLLPARELGTDIISHHLGKGTLSPRVFWGEDMFVSKIFVVDLLHCISLRIYCIYLNIHHGSLGCCSVIFLRSYSLGFWVLFVTAFAGL